MAGHNYFFLKLAGRYTNNMLLEAGVGGGFHFPQEEGSTRIFLTFEWKMARFGAF